MNGERHICFVANQGQHYRLPIFREMDEELDCHFYLGDRLETPIKPFKYTILTGYKKTLRNHYFGHFYWQSGALSVVWEKYDAYIFTGEPFCLSTWLILLLLKLRRVQTVSWTHGWYGREGKIKTWVKKTYFSLFTDIWVYGNYAIGLMAEAGISRTKMRCIANSLDSRTNQHIRQGLTPQDVYKEHFGNNLPVVIYCGRIQRVKKLDMLIDSLALLKESGHAVNLIVIGEDVEGVGLETYARNKGVKENVWFYGPCYDDEQLATFFYNAHVCVSPGNIGLTAIHAMSFGCPAITHGNFAHQMPEFEAIRPGVTGDFFKEDDVKDLAVVIRRWTAMTAEKREEVRQAAFEEIDRKWNVGYQMDIIQQTLKIAKER